MLYLNNNKTICSFITTIQNLVNKSCGTCEPNFHIFSNDREKGKHRKKKKKSKSSEKQRKTLIVSPFLFFDLFKKYFEINDVFYTIYVNGF